MNKINHTKSKAEKRKARVRAKVRGTAERPRLTIYRSNKHTYLQAIDDQAGKTIASSNDKVIKAKSGTKTELAQKAAEALSAALQKAGVTKVVIDRGPYKYHGRIKAIAEAARAAGLEV
jgi:large subunit ribosomal protein L18